MKVIPCAVCGYDAPGESCPHCGGAPEEPSLRAATSGPFSGLPDGLFAVPKGLYYLLTQRGLKRWLVPPMMATATVLVMALVLSFSWLSGLIDTHVPSEFELGDGSGYAWMQDLPTGLGWVASAWGGLVIAIEWLVNSVWALMTSKPLRFVGWFLVGSVIAWYCFSIAYEAFAGPFLDTIQGRLEGRWFGSDPRDRLERPEDVDPEQAARWAGWSSVLAAALLLVPWLCGLSLLLALPLGLLGFLPACLLVRGFPAWLWWMARVESRAAWTSIKTSLVTLVLLILALPLYFVPVVGYFLFATVTGFATAIGLLDIPFERRGWSLRQRVAFVFRNLVPLIAFGVVSGFLLAVPILGAVLMVPASSLGGLWLVCRLDKGFLRPRASTATPVGSAPVRGTAAPRPPLPQPERPDRPEEPGGPEESTT